MKGPATNPPLRCFMAKGSTTVGKARAGVSTPELNVCHPSPHSDPIDQPNHSTQVHTHATNASPGVEYTREYH